MPEHEDLWWAVEGHGFQLYTGALQAFPLNPVHMFFVFFCSLPTVTKS